MINNVFRYFAALMMFNDPQGDIQGKVRNCETNPVVGVEVCIQDSQGHTECDHTDRNGRFEFRNVPVGKYGVFVASDQWYTVRYRDLHVRQGGLSTVKFDVRRMPLREFECSTR